MKIINYISLIFTVLHLSFNLSAADKFDVKLITDRDILVSGENLLAKIYLNDQEDSKVVYLDLISVGGNHISGAKFSVEDYEATGFLNIPDSLQTGAYFLRVFTNQNQDQAFLLKELLVINRFEFKQEQFVLDRVHFETGKPQVFETKITNLKSVYSKRENVSVNINDLDSQLDQFDGNLVLSVTQDAGQFSTGERLIQRDQPETKFVNENKGIVLKGKVLDKSTDNPVWGAMVFLSVPDSIPFFDYYKTNDDGSFYFLLKDFYGNSPLIIQASKSGKNENLRIELEEKFRNISLEFPVQKEALPEKLNEYVKESAQLVTFKKIFNTKEYLVEKKERVPVYPYPFYGEPVQQVDPDLFFDLKDFKELSHEILSGVKYRDRKNEYSLVLIDQQMHDYFKTEPFMLIDGVPIDQISMLSDLGTKEIDWVDIIPRERFFGDLKFNGVLAIYTKENNATRILPSDHLLKLNYEGLQNRVLLADSYPSAKNVPDFRQVLYWDPNLKPEEKISLEFKCSDVKGDFKLRIAGKTKSGKLVESVQTFKVN